MFSSSLHEENNTYPAPFLNFFFLLTMNQHKSLPFHSHKSFWAALKNKRVPGVTNLTHLQKSYQVEWEKIWQTNVRSLSKRETYKMPKKCFFIWTQIFFSISKWIFLHAFWWPLTKRKNALKKYIKYIFAVVDSATTVNIVCCIYVIEKKDNANIANDIYVIVCYFDTTWLVFALSK